MSAMDESRFRVLLLGVPVALALATIEYGEAVIRELTLLAIDPQGSEELSGHLDMPVFDIGPFLEALYQARSQGADLTDLELHFRSGAGGEANRRAAVI